MGTTAVFYFEVSLVSIDILGPLLDIPGEPDTSLWNPLLSLFHRNAQLVRTVSIKLPRCSGSALSAASQMRPSLPPLAKCTPSSRNLHCSLCHSRDHGDDDGSFPCRFFNQLRSPHCFLGLALSVRGRWVRGPFFVLRCANSGSTITLPLDLHDIRSHKAVCVQSQNRSVPSYYFGRLLSFKFGQHFILLPIQKWAHAPLKP